ncbi:hypothetical protein Nepgr_026769 [Nepenthes gracilis]|uniref:Uncharacterized protein n=1 Tax=Nepenthes gracilis TaxID=150966 RepID=A0AAD3T954_NEPGR|nr:hypothetical protein Nepgr_026769 [Nepenthes gracilis]
MLAVIHFTDAPSHGLGQGSFSVFKIKCVSLMLGDIVECTKELPEGSWHCPNCACRICGDPVKDEEVPQSYADFKCSQCDHEYHEVCLKGKGMDRVYAGLQSRTGLSNQISDGFSWALLRCVHDDQKVHSAQWFALKAEC